MRTAHPHQRSELLTLRLFGVFGPFFGRHRFFVSKCMSPAFLSLIIKMGIQEIAYLYKSLHLYWIYPPLLSLLQIPWGPVACKYCMYSNQLCSSHNYHIGSKHSAAGFLVRFWFSSYIFETTFTFQWHQHCPLILQGITPPTLNLSRYSPSTRRQFAVLMRSLFSRRTRSTRTNISLPSSPTAVLRLPSLMDTSLSNPPYRNTNFRPSVLFQKLGPSYSFFFEFYFNTYQFAFSQFVDDWRWWKQRLDFVRHHYC